MGSREKSGMENPYEAKRRESAGHRNIVFAKILLAAGLTAWLAALGGIIGYEVHRDGKLPKFIPEQYSPRTLIISQGRSDGSFSLQDASLQRYIRRIDEQCKILSLSTYNHDSSIMIATDTDNCLATLNQ